MIIDFLPPPARIVDTPYELLGAHWPARTARKSVALALCRQLEDQAANQADPPVVLSTFQHQRFFTPATAARYGRLARNCPLVAVIGVDPEAVRPPGVRAISLTDDDPLRQQWSTVIVGAHFAVAFLALDLGDNGPDEDRRFDFNITYDRETAVAAGRSLLTRFT